MAYMRGSVWKNIDWWTVGLYLALVIYGWFSICGASYNYGEPEFFDLATRSGIIETLQEMLADDDPRKALVSKDLISYVADRKGHDRRYAIAPDKIKKEIGWYPETMFKEGIKKTIAWYFEHEDWMERVTSGDYQKYYNEMYKA